MSKQIFIALLMGSLLVELKARAFESRLYGDQQKKTKVNPRSVYNFPKTLEIYNVDFTPQQDKSAVIRQLHTEGKRVICFLTTVADSKGQSKSIEQAMNAGCDEVTIR